MKIRFLPIYPASVVYGGQEVVQEALIAALRSQRPDWDVGMVDFSSRETLADIYHVVGNSFALSNIIRFIPPNIPLVVSVIDGVRDDSALKRLPKIAVSAFVKFFREETRHDQLSYLFRRADVVLPLHSRAAKFVRSRYGVPFERIQVMPNGVPSAFFSRPEASGCDVLVSGTLIRRKGTREVIEFAESNFGQKFKFHFIGGLQNNELEYGHECIARIHSAKNCIYHGFVQQQSDQFWGIFDQCRYFLQLSTEETQSLSALEAIAGGRRCIFRRAPYSSVAPFDKFPSVLDTSPACIYSAFQASDCQVVDRSAVHSWDDIASKLVKIYEDKIA